MIHFLVIILLNLIIFSVHASSCEEIKKKYTCYETEFQDGVEVSVPKTYPVHLTFDDGPIAGRTEKVLAALKKHEVPATFFVVGNLLESSKSHGAIRILRKIKAEGHMIGSHSYEHVTHTTQPKSKVTELIRKARVAGLGKEVDGKKTEEYLTQPLLFRFPYGDGWHPLTVNPKNKDFVMNELSKEGFSHIGWDFHAYDWDRDKQQNPGILDILLKEICEKKGGIALLHDNQLNTVNNIDSWIEAMKCLGHEFVDLKPFFNNDDAVNVCEGAKFALPLEEKSIPEVEVILEEVSEEKE
jgi:peptidoglycan/xylan/chitin deacetylase (PgdA/CDA1 family)